MTFPNTTLPSCKKIAALVNSIISTSFSPSCKMMEGEIMLSSLGLISNGNFLTSFEIYHEKKKKTT